MWKQFANKINELSKDMIPVWTNVKKNMLEGRYFDSNSSQILKMMHVNPEIQFISNNVVEESMLPIKYVKKYFTTMETYEKFYKPIVQEVIDGMVSKGYCSDTYTIKYDKNTNLSDNIVFWEYNNLGKYNEIVENILIHKLKKLYCKKIVQGVEFTSILEGSSLL